MMGKQKFLDIKIGNLITLCLIILFCTLPCSVIQGSKLSALLYTVYINEVTVLQKLMGTELYGQITNDMSIKSERIDHDIIQYVDDTNNIIYGNNAEEVEKYSNAYFKLIECFYGIN